VLTAWSATVQRAPTGQTAMRGDAQVASSWAASSRATHDDIDHSTTSEGAGNTPIKMGNASTAFSDPGPSNGTKDSFQVTAINNAGRRGKSREVSATITISETSLLLDADLVNDNAFPWSQA
jgi:cellulose 1,4-beta-cellobiosidase